jgi:hypothetical protein
MKLPIIIEYNSGESATYIAQPPEWAKWERKLVSQSKPLKSGWKQFQM